jgi:hypothetical protein
MPVLQTGNAGSTPAEATIAALAQTDRAPRFERGGWGSYPPGGTNIPGSSSDRTAASEAAKRGLNPCPGTISRRRGVQLNAPTPGERPRDMRKVGRSSRPAGTNRAVVEQQTLSDGGGQQLVQVHSCQRDQTHAIVAKWQTRQHEELAGGDAHYEFNSRRSHYCRCSSMARAHAF